jgi:uncharacterized lipoprotein YddW (UPF0748 family)/subtilase family serine protease
MNNQLSRRVLNNPTYFDQLRAKLAALLKQEFTEEKLFPTIDAYTAEICALAHQDPRKWATNEQFDRESDRLKDWIQRRRAFLHKELGLAASPPAKADTIVSAVGFDRLPLVDGEQVRFEATVRNVGGASTGTTVGVAFLVDGRYITYGTSGPLEPGVSRVIKSVSGWTAVAGMHTLTAVVDDVNRYPEVSETNNALQTQFEVDEKPAPTLSDVIVRDIAFQQNQAGQVRLAAQVTNVGQAATAEVVGVAFLVDDRFVTFGVTEPMQPGETKAILAVQWLSLTSRRKVTAIVDDINRFPESSEQNNSRTEFVDFGAPTPQLSDTVVLEVSLGRNGRFSEDDNLTFEARVKNIGTAVTGSVVGVAFLVDGRYITFGNTTSIPPGETRLIRAISAWRAVAGRHRLLAVVDDVNRYPELSETNNQFELEFEVFKRQEIMLPDSTLESIDFEIDESDWIVLMATVSNIGAAPTPDLVGVAFFVDGRYATFGIAAPMAPGTTEVIRAVQSLPLEGHHEITAVVDDVNRFDELSHHNNKLERDIEFRPRVVERRAIWITRYDWTRVGQVPGPNAIDEIVNNVAEAGFNTIFFQVRGAGDAFYTPGLEPWAARLTGTVWETQGQDPGWDPLAYVLKKARTAGLEVHAYVNVYSVWVAPPNENYGQLAPPATTPPHLFDRLTYGPDHQEHPGQHALGAAWRQHDAPDRPMPLEWGKTLWASPGVDPVRDHTVAVIADIVSRYAVDGVHLDLIRYANRPYSFDPISNAAAGSEKTPQRDQWQRDRITDLVRRVQAQISTIRPGAWISAAVWPYYQNKWGWRVSQGYSDYYQDSKGWLAVGLADAIAPMMYGAAADEFDKWRILLNDFLVDSHGCHVYPGIGADYDDFDAIVQRIEAARKAGAPGHAIYAYGALNRRSYWPKLAEGPYAEAATLPTHPAVVARLEAAAGQESD